MPELHLWQCDSRKESKRFPRLPARFNRTLFEEMGDLGFRRCLDRQECFETTQ